VVHRKRACILRIDIPVKCKYLRMDIPIISQVNGVWSYEGVPVTGKGIYVAACARSGTVYISNVLKALGYKIGHERTDIDGSVGYHLAIVKPKNCFHQVRHPLKQIASMLDHQAWSFMKNVVNIGDDEGLLGCMQYWLRWNELLEEFCIWRYQIEQLPMYWNEFVSRIDHRWCLLPEIKKQNTREINSLYSNKKITELSWRNLIECDEVLAEKIYDKHLEYGYSPAIGTERRPCKSQDSRLTA
jgi:hypothetical protein